MGNVDYVKTSRFGASIGILTYLLAWVVGFFVKNGGSPQATLDFIPTLTEGVKQNLQAGINTDLSSRVLAWLSGISPFDLMGLITVAIGGILIAVVGASIVNAAGNTAVGKYINKTMLREIVGITVLGSLVIAFGLTLFAGNPALPALWATVTMAIYFTIVAFVYRGLQTVFPALEKNKILVSP